MENNEKKKIKNVLHIERENKDVIFLMVFLYEEKLMDLIHKKLETEMWSQLMIFIQNNKEVWIRDPF